MNSLLIFSIAAATALNVPEKADTSWKTYMSYKCITCRVSKQWELQQKAYTDKHGLRKYDGRYMIAVGTPYGKVGDYVDVELENGDILECVIGDSKGDRDYHLVYDEKGRVLSYNVVEFIADTPLLDKKAKNWGDISQIDGFAGNVVSIVKEDEDEHY